MGKHEDNINEFNDGFEYVKKTLEQKNEITSSDDKKSGIYALYINAYTNDIEEREKLIIPIYIGQTKNLLRRKKQHFEKIEKILSLTKEEFNLLLKKHREKTYLYFKIRKCLNDCNLTIENISMKVIEYCEPETNILEEKEQYYIEKLYGIKYGFNQFESIHLIPQFNPVDEYFYEFLMKAKKDLKDCIDGKYYFGFSSFNISNLNYNISFNMRKMYGYTTKSEEILKLKAEVIELYKKLNEDYDFHIYGDLSPLYFIYDELKI